MLRACVICLGVVLFASAACRLHTPLTPSVEDSAASDVGSDAGPSDTGGGIDTGGDIGLNDGGADAADMADASDMVDMYTPPGCGDGNVDDGEECDDGNAESHDGCSSSCTTEQPTWTELADEFGRYDHAAAFDASRGVLVIHGGQVGEETLSDTLEFDGAAVMRVSTQNAPGPRSDHEMVYDSARGVVVLFGGLDENSDRQSDTWEYDGSDWVHVTTANAPPAREDFAMAYDAARSRVVLFGGSDAQANPTDDTWEYDGADWTRVDPPVAFPPPPAREEHALAYDPDGQVVRMFGGQGASDTLADTWEYDGNRWMETVPAFSPPARRRHAMTSAHGGGVLVVGGEPFSVASELWRFDGTDWTELSADGPTRRSRTGVGYDPGNDRVILFGGVSYVESPHYGELSDAWSWDGDGWELRWSEHPFPRDDPGLVFDPDNARVILYGGDFPSDGPAFGDTWELGSASSTWTKLDISSPPARADFGFVWTPNGALAFGGIDNGPLHDDTWRFSAGTWTELMPANAPSPRQDFVMSYDSARDVVVLFGGQGGGVLDETWEFSGGDWTQRMPTTSPSARRWAMSGYHEPSGRVVVLGGEESSGRSDEVWTWDGTDWELVDVTGGPGSVDEGCFTYHLGANRFVLFGGETSSGEAGTWELDVDSASWQEIPFAEGPERREGCDLVYDATRDGIILFGGSRDDARSFHDTWLYRYE